jgi:uncharacterized phiE125 gp8 family phage protein
MFALITPPTIGEVVQLADVKRDLRLGVGETEFDNDIESQIGAAVEEIESDCRRQLLTAEWRLYLDRFPVYRCGERTDVLIEKCPVITIDEIRYLDAAGVQQTLATDQYRVDTISEPARISPAYGVIWPTTRAVTNAVEIDFTAGYGAAEVHVPEIAKQIIRLRVQELFGGCAAKDAVEQLKMRLKWGEGWRQA